MEKSVPQGFLTEATAPVKVTVRTDNVADHYNVEPRPFARGKFATVRRCVHRESGRDFAAKYIRKRRRASDVRHEIVHEALVLKMAEPCARVVDVREVFETHSELILILELAAGGELQHVLDSEECLPEKDVVRLMRQILEAVQFLHERKHCSSRHQAPEPAVDVIVPAGRHPALRLRHLPSHRQRHRDPRDRRHSGLRRS
ncbi:hypothetical protein MRX96_027010 [Rhipicephalus microplus]